MAEVLPGPRLGAHGQTVLCTVLAGFALADAMTAASSSCAVTFVCRLAAGAFGDVLWAMLAPAAVRMALAERRGRAIAIVLAGITAALALGIPAAAALASLLGWRMVAGMSTGRWRALKAAGIATRRQGL